MAMITFNDQLADGIRLALAGDPERLSKVVDHARLKMGMTYCDIYQRAVKCRPEFTQADWDDLMAACDDADSRES